MDPSPVHSSTIWVSKESIRRKYEDIKVTSVPVAWGKIPSKEAIKILTHHSKLVMVGFDVLQVPRHKIIFVK